MSIEKIIVVEDDLAVCRSLERCLRARRFEVVVASNLAEAKKLLSNDTFDMVFLDVQLPDGDGTELLKAIQLHAQKPMVVITTGFGTVESAVECMKNGAFDYLIKPFSPEQIDVTLRKADELSQLIKVNQFLSQDSEDAGYDLLGRSPAMESLRQLLRKVGRTQATVLIQGESGTGKELVARALYRESPRAGAPFIRVNCAAIPENLIESEFFGHEKGAFTGALARREGRFELAHGGTILLDEISEVSPNIQAKLLRVLQERELERVGGNRTIKVDVRIIATTNRNLEQSVEKKEFRQDLFFRLNVVPVFVPPLRERREDVEFLAQEFVRRFSRKHGVHIRGLANETKQVLIQHAWPGNVRELQNVIERAVILCGDNCLIEPAHLGMAGSGSTPSSPPLFVPPVVASEAGTPTLAEMEKRHILAVLEQCGGNRTHAAKQLGVSIRTLRNKLHDYSGIEPRADEMDDNPVAD